MHITTRKLTAAAVTGAAYAALTMLLAPISYGAIQCRVSEVLCILPFFIPCTAWGLFAGCAIANVLTGNIFDITFGSLATLAAVLTAARLGQGKHTLLSEFLACSANVVINAFVLNRETHTPATKPESRPKPSAIAIASGTGNPVTASIVYNPPPLAATLPPDMSICPPSRTINWPAAM